MNLILLWLLIIPEGWMFHQNDYKLIFERIEVAGFNTDYVGLFKSHNFKYNRTQALVNLTSNNKFAFGNELKLEVQAYKFASNEYRLFPLRFMFDYCEYTSKDEFGLKNLWNCDNSTGCPFKKGIYHSCSWTPNEKRFPLYIPEGSYMLDLKYFYHSVEVIFMQAYGTIKYPILKTKQFN